ncbi:MAG: hypothetical protein Q7I99_09495 [Acholeplasmataceae bacterium]|nr:hypothetical protein [Acholeplasmataceae bacterium]
MKLLKSKKGMSLPTILGIVAFVLGTTATLLSYVFFQSKLVNISIENTEAYENAVQKVNATLKIITRDKLLDDEYLRDLETYMDVSIELYSTNLWTVSSMVSDTKQVTSYITGSTAAVNSFETIFQNTGEEPTFVLNPLITSGSLLSSYLPKYMETNFPSITPETNFTTFQSVIDYIRVLALANQGFSLRVPNDLQNQSNPTALSHWYIQGSVTIPNNKDLTIPDNRLLVIDGSLTMNRGSTIYGNVIVNGNVVINGQGNSSQGLQGTIYANGNVNFAKNLIFGTASRPSFVFAEKDITLDNIINGYGYFLCQNFTAKQGNIYITGGVYTSDDQNIQRAITENTNLNTDAFYDYAVPLLIEVENTDPISGGTIGDFKYTSPKIGS